MGIKNLTKLIQEVAPRGIKEQEMKSFMGRKIAIDASMAIYQFLVAIRGASEGGGAAVQLTDSDGNTTSHLQGCLSRTVKLIEAGIKPVWVFDGAPPEMKGEELLKRKEARDKAEIELKEAEQSGSVEDVEKYNKRLVKMTTEHKEECKKLLKLLGVPIVEAPMEAEAQCATMCKEGKVWGVATEDMDAMTFAAPILIRRLCQSDSKKLPVLEFNLEIVLEDLKLNQDEFIDLCILMGCDYVSNIRGVGMKKAYEMIVKYRTIESVIAHLDKEKYQVPTDNFDFVRARALFKDHTVLKGESVNLKWTEPDEAGLIKFLCTEKGFDETRIKNAVEKLRKAKSKGSQTRMDSFFKAVPVSKDAIKRKAEPLKEKTNVKKSKK